MRIQGALLLAVISSAGCVGPGQHLHGGHSFHRSRPFGHRDPVGGLLAILEGVALIADLASSASREPAYERPARQMAPPPPPSPPPPPPRPQSHWLHGTLVMPKTPNIWLPVMRVALKAVNQEEGMFLAYSACNHAGQFSFALPPVGDYKLEVVDPFYEGELLFTTDGVSDLPLVMPMASRPM